jgi:hypothetical protein
MKRPLLTVCLLALALVMAGCAGGSDDEAPSDPRATGVRDLQRIGQLSAAFDARREQPRLVLLVSPT